MNEAAQIVLLIDIDSICRETGEDFRSRIRDVRRLSLRVLTGLSTNYCSKPVDHRKQLQQINLKFGYKYYYSNASGKHSAPHQRHNFVDFTADSFEEFERNLAATCQERVVASVGTDPGGSSRRVPETGNPRQTGCLERELKNMLCDYTWDNPTLSSPVRATRSVSISKNVGEQTTDSFVVLFARAPATIGDLLTLMGRKTGNPVVPSAASVLDWLLPATVRQMFHGNLRINLLWIELSTLLCGADSDPEGKSCLDSLVVINEALLRINGRLLPASAFVPKRSIGGTLSTPALLPSLQFVSPLTSLLEKILCVRPKPSRNVDLRWKCEDETDCHVQLELLPLLKCFERCSCISKSDTPGCKSFARKARTFGDAEQKIAGKLSPPTTSAGSTCINRWMPRSVRCVDTLPLAVVHRRVMERPLSFLCHEILNSSAGDEAHSDFSQLMQLLTVQRLAMVVSCDSICLGMLLPVNSRCRAGILHVLLSNGKIPLFATESAGSVTTPTKTPRIKTFAKRLLADWEVQSLAATEFVAWSSTPADDPVQSLKMDTLEAYFALNHCDRELIKESSCSGNEQLLLKRQENFQALQSTYLPAEPFMMNVTPAKKIDLLSRVSSPNACVRRSPRITKSNTMNVSDRVIRIVSQSILSKKAKENVSDLRRSSCESNASHSSLTLVTSVGREAFLSPAITDEKDLEDNVRNMYEATLVGSKGLLTSSQHIINLVLLFFKSEDVESKAKAFLTGTVLLTSGQVTKKYSGTDSSRSKDRRICEYCFQVFLWSEWLSSRQRSYEETSVDAVISHLRMLPFVAGPTKFSKFLNDEVIERYYPLMKEVVVTICEELNQPLPSNHPVASSEGEEEEEATENTSTCSPDKFGSVPSLISTLGSNLSSCSSQSRSRRCDAFHRHPSYASIGSSRQIIVSKVRSRSRKEMPTSERVTRSAEKRRSETAESQRRLHLERQRRKASASQGFVATQLHFTPPRRKKPTTPNGRHVLKTKVIAETPTHKQVANAILHKQALGRKRNFETMANESMVVEESPDEKRTGVPLRRSPRTRPPVPLGRKASFYSGGQESQSRNVERACNQERSKGDRQTSDTSFLLLDVTQSPWKQCPPSDERRLADKSDAISSHHSRVKRHLSMSGSFSPAAKTRKENVTPASLGEDGLSSKRNALARRSARVKLFANVEPTEWSAVEKTPKSSKVAERRFSPSPRRSLRHISSSWEVLKAVVPTGRTRSGTKKNAEDLWSGNKWASAASTCQQTPDSKTDCHLLALGESPKIPPPLKTVSRKLLQTPSKSADSGTCSANDSATAWESQYFVPVTPHSFDEDCTGQELCLFPPGPLACDKWEEHMSASSSPYVPLFPDYDPCRENANGHAAFSYSQYNESTLASSVEEQTGTVIDSSKDFSTSTDSNCTEKNSKMFSSTESSDAPCDALGFSVFDSSTEEKRKTDLRKPVVVTNQLEFAEIYHRFTRRESKEIGITPDDFRKIATDSFPKSNPACADTCKSPKALECFARPKSVTNSAKSLKQETTRSEQRRSSKAKTPPSAKRLITPPSIGSLFHLTTSPILSPVTSRLTRNSSKREQS